MAHGDKENRLEDRNGIMYDYNQILLQKFSDISAPHLTEILKIVIIVACRWEIKNKSLNGNKLHFFSNETLDNFAIL